MPNNPYAGPAGPAGGPQSPSGSVSPPVWHECRVVVNALNGIARPTDDALRIARLDELDHLDIAMCIDAAQVVPPFTPDDAQKIAHYLAWRSEQLRNPENREPQRMQQPFAIRDRK